MTTLITGACGFVGSFLSQRFLADGEKVVAYDIAPSTNLLNRLLSDQQQKSISIVQGDLLDLPLMLRVARQHKVNRIVHLGCMVTAPTRANPGLAQAVNVVGTNNVFEMALEIGAPRVVWASTIDVFGPKSVSADGIVRNDAAYDPQGVYGGTKVMNEISSKDYARDFGLDPVAIRIPAAFGPEIPRSWARFIPNLIRSVVAGEVGQAPKLTKVMPWLYVEDIADAFRRACDIPRSDTVAFTLGGDEKGIDVVIDLVRKLFPNAKPFTPIDWPDFGTVPSYDGSQARAALQWSPKWGLEGGLKRIAEFYQAHPTR